jgi:outer membrane PBP1 activator LpoA protein
MTPIDRLSLRRLASACLAALVLAACAAQTPGYANQAAPRRCDRNGDIDERKACN